MNDRLRFFLAVVLVAVCPATFAVAFRTSLTVLYRTVYDAENVVLSLFEAWFDRHPTPQPFGAMIGGALVGAIAVWLPAVA